MTVLSAKQLDMMRAVEAGRVAYRDPWPRLSERTGTPGIPRWHLDGAEAYGGEHSTLDSLVANGLVSETVEGSVVELTHDGRLILAAADEVAAASATAPKGRRS